MKSKQQLITIRTVPKKTSSSNLIFPAQTKQNLTANGAKEVKQKRLQPPLQTLLKCSSP